MKRSQDLTTEQGLNQLQGQNQRGDPISLGAYKSNCEEKLEDPVQIDKTSIIPIQRKKGQTKLQKGIYTIDEIRTLNLELNKKWGGWCLHAKVTFKRDIRISPKGIKWFSCMLQDQKKDMMELKCFEDVELWQDKLLVGQHYDFYKPVVVYDINEVVKVKLGMYSCVYLMTSFENPRPPSQIIPQSNLGPSPMLMNLKLTSQSQVFDKIAYCFNLEIPTKNQNPNKPIRLFLCDEFNNIKKVNIWKDHNVTLPQPHSFIYLKNISHRGNLQAEVFHSTKTTRILSEKQAYDQLGLTIDTFVPEKIEKTAFERKPCPSWMVISSLDEAMRKEGYHYVPAQVIVGQKDIQIKSLCENCQVTHRQGMQFICCGSFKPRNYYNVRCTLSDWTGSVPAVIHYTLVQSVANITNNNSLEEANKKVQPSLQSLSFNRELFKIQTKFLEGKPSLRVLEVMVRNISQEITMLKDTLQQ